MHSCRFLPTARVARVLALTGLMPLFAVALGPATSRPLAGLVDDRRRVERIYHEHRSGRKPAFDDAFPVERARQLVRRDKVKEAILRSRYGIEVPEAAVEAEVRRIDATSRAPAILGEIKSALGGDAERFAATVARPLVVDRLLRRRFLDDESLHRSARERVESIRSELLRGKASSGEPAWEQLRRLSGGESREMRWDLSDRVKADGRGAPAAGLAAPGNAVGSPAPAVTSRSANYTVEANVHREDRHVGGKGVGTDGVFPFADLDPGLQEVIRGRLLRPGDVSPVIEGFEGFFLGVLRDRTAEHFRVEWWRVPRRDYDGWLEGMVAEFGAGTAVDAP